jgi:MoaA/NifB/PqqE/SkfB family radical SAM enzyme
MKKYLTDAKRADIPCVMGYFSIYIGAHGEVYPGCLVLEPVGNVREKKLEEIVNPAEYRKRLKDMFYKRCPGCACGHKVNLLYHLPSLFKEIPWVARSRMGFLSR